MGMMATPAEAELAGALRLALKPSTCCASGTCGHCSVCRAREVLRMWDERQASAVDDCTGDGMCHGCIAWCAWCGDVSRVCDDPGLCSCHPRCACGVVCTSFEAENEGGVCAACQPAFALGEGLAALVPRANNQLRTWR